MTDSNPVPSRYDDDERPTWIPQNPPPAQPNPTPPPVQPGQSAQPDQPTLGQYAHLFNYGPQPSFPPPVEDDSPLPSGEGAQSWIQPSTEQPTVLTHVVSDAVQQPSGQGPAYAQQPPMQAVQPMQPVQPVQAPPQIPVIQQMPRKAKRGKTGNQRRRRSRWNVACLGCAMGLVTMVVLFICVGTVVFAIVWNSVNEVLNDRLEKEIKRQQQEQFQTTHIYDRSGNSLYEVIGEGRRTEIKLADVSKSLIDATIAVEDATFYDNPGVDLSAITRAGLQYFSGNESGGASTITQQLVRNIAFDPAYRVERSAKRKIEEILMAMALTRIRTKDEILIMYLNTIPYGNWAYGIEAAAQTYFGKHAKDLSLAEAALLAGLPQAPARLNPLDPDPEVQALVLGRRKIVLDLMVEKGKITRAQADDAEKQPLTYANPNVSLKSPHFTLYAEDELKALLPAINLPESYVKTGGLSVYTTLDSDYQTLAENVARNQIAQIKGPHNANNAAVIVLKPVTGEILAMVGSVDYNDDSIDGRVNVVTSKRQPGSSIKPLMYADALEQGYSAATVLWDVEMHIDSPGQDTYSPKNYDRSWHGPVRMRDALANSYNIPAVSMLRQIGVDSLLSFAERLGIQSLGRDASKYGLALTLGGGEVTPLEEAQAYSVFANGGKLVPARAILCVVNSDGQIVYEYEKGCDGRPNAKRTENSISATASGKMVLDPRIAFVISDILNDNKARTPAMGSNSPLRTDGIASSVKTGTTDNYRDNWTMGYTKNVVVGVWVGNTDNKEMKNTTGLTGAAPIWNGVITGIYGNAKLMETLKYNGALREDKIAPPADLPMRQQQLCVLSSVIEPGTGDCQRGRSEWLLASPPMVPDSSGNLKPSTDSKFMPTTAPRNGPAMEDLDPGVTRAVVSRLDPALAAAMVANVRGYKGMLSPSPLYCLVPNEVQGQVPSATPQLFIKGPVFDDEYMYASLYAQAGGLAILPRIPCNQQMLSNVPGAIGVTTVIASPKPGDTVSGTVYVAGSALWGGGQALFFKMEIRGPQFPNWTTFSGPTYQPIGNGALGNFGASGLQPGTYYIRIVVIGNDANTLQESAAVPINVTGQ